MASEAAQIEGAGNYTVMFRIVFPMISKIFTTLCLIEFITLWNDYTYPLLYLNSYPTLAYGIFYLVFQNQAAALPVQHLLLYLLIWYIPVFVINQQTH